MKILHICDWYVPFGGAEKLMFDTLEALELQGYTNIMVINKHPEQITTSKRYEYQVAHIEIDFSNFRFYNYIHIYKAKRKISEIIKKHKPDICHIHNCQNPYIIKMLLKKLPCVRSIHDPRLYCFTQWRLLPDKKICPYPLGQKCLENKCIVNLKNPLSYHEKIAPWIFKNFLIHRKMPFIILESRALIKCVLQNGYKEYQIAWLPNCTKIYPEQETARLIKKLYNPKENHVVFVGRASYEKGLDVLLDASKLIKTNCTIHLITGGPYLDRIKERIKKENLEKIVKLHGILSYEKTRKFYIKSDIVVVPSVWIESFCLVGLEAMANQKPVVGSKIGGIKDWLVDGKTGFLFEPGNPADLALKIDTLLNDKKLCVKMGLNGYNRVKKYYNRKIYLERLIKIYKDAIKKCA